uniref:Mitotic checkpoint protein BUB3 n=1 Tax=Aceria tosichella TaxID=561515 RepID=A0A6G1S9I3_9ACAR
MTLNYDGTPNEFRLDNAPTDCIQSVKFGQVDNQHLLAASWDCTVRLYDVRANELRTQYTHDAPVLDATFQGNNNCWSAGADNKVKRYDFQSQTESVVGLHTQPVRCVEYNQDVNLIGTGSWDAHLKLWDPRLADSSQKALVEDHVLPDKVYTMSICGHRLIVGLAGRRVLIWDLRNMTHVQKESFLKYQIRCIESFPDQRGYVVSSIEGRVAVEYLDPSPEVQKQRYAFKCHRNKDPTTGLEIVYPVNAISFHRKYNTFATGGSDGYVSVWDGKNKKRVVQFHRYPTSITSLSFSPDGSTLATACSYLHSSEDTQNMREIPQDTIYIRRIHDHEVRNKG